MKPDTIRWFTRDNSNKMSVVSFRVPNATAPATVVAGLGLMAIVSSAAWATETQETVLEEPSGDAGVSSAYGTHRDFARLRFESATKEDVNVNIPAPVNAMFLADNETVDASNANVEAVIAWILENGRSSSGQALQRYVTGNRWRFNG